jgi:hypothetical protein
MPYKDKQKAKEYALNYYQENKQELSERSKEWYINNIDKRKASQREWTKRTVEQRKQKRLENLDSINRKKEENLPKHILGTIKQRCKKRGLDFNLEESDIILPENCPVFGFKLNYTQGRGYKRDGYSVDRINPSLGYVKGNIQILSQLANFMKQDADDKELQMFADWINRKDFKTSEIV